MSPAELALAHEKCERTLETSIVEARRTCVMLRQRSEAVASLEGRSALFAQRSRENKANADHMEARQRLFEFINRRG